MSSTSTLTKLQPLLWVGIFVQSLVAMLGSLYYSTFGDPVVNYLNGNLFTAGHGLVPCDLCWYARILMYPIVLISYIGIAKKDKRFTDYVLPLSMIGVVLDIYHYSIQKLPIDTFFSCSSAVPCNALQVNYLGFVTIPFLALLAFTFITIMCLLNMWINKKVAAEAKKGDHE